MNPITEPAVFLHGYTQYHDSAIGPNILDTTDFLMKETGGDWQREGRESDVTPEVAGRLCYMSFDKPRPGGNEAYIRHIKEVGHGSVLEHTVFNLIITGVSRSLTHELVRHRSGFGYSQLSQRYVDSSGVGFVVPQALQKEVAAAECYFSWKEGYEEAAGKISHEEAVKEYLSYFSPVNHGLTEEVIEAGRVWLAAMEKSKRDYAFFTDYLTKKQEKEGRLDEVMSEVERRERQTGMRKEARQAARSVLPNATETKIFVTVNARAARHFIEQRGSRFADPEIRMLAWKVCQAVSAVAPNLFSDYTWTFDGPNDDGSVWPVDVQTPYRKV